MKHYIINEIKKEMSIILDLDQLNKLIDVLENQFSKVEIIATNNSKYNYERNNNALLENFISAKSVEGCSYRSIIYYKSTLDKIIQNFKKPINQIETEDLRNYLSEYQKEHNVGKQTLDNVRRILSSFFSWLEDENYIIKSPVRRIHKIKTIKQIKETYSDEMMVSLRDNCNSIRDLAIIDILSSTGMRVGELVKLNKSDIDFENREIIVLGKGSKERIVYFDAKTKIHLQNYLASRKDDNPALFVSLLKPYKRLEISGVEITLRKLGRQIGINKVHPHKFRRTLATKAIDKGMPIEQVQVLLGHKKIDTTMEYAMVNQENVKNSHKKYIT